MKEKNWLQELEEQLQLWERAAQQKFSLVI